MRRHKHMIISLRTIAMLFTKGEHRYSMDNDGLPKGSKIISAAYQRGRSDITFLIECGEFPLSGDTDNLPILIPLVRKLTNAR